MDPDPVEAISPIVIPSDDDDDDDDVILLKEEKAPIVRQGGEDEKETDDIIFVLEELPSNSQGKCKGPAKASTNDGNRKVDDCGSSNDDDRSDLFSLPSILCYPFECASINVIEDILRPLDLSQASGPESQSGITNSEKVVSLSCSESLDTWDHSQPTPDLNKAEELVAPKTTGKPQSPSLKFESIQGNKALNDISQTLYVPVCETHSKTDFSDSKSTISFPCAAVCVDSTLNPGVPGSSVDNSPPACGSLLPTATPESTVPTIVSSFCPHVHQVFNSNEGAREQTVSGHRNATLGAFERSTGEFCNYNTPNKLMLRASEGSSFPPCNSAEQSEKECATSPSSSGHPGVTCTKTKHRQEVENPLKLELGELSRTELEKLVDFLSPDIVCPVSTTDIDSMCGTAQGQVKLSHDNCSSYSSTDIHDKRGETEKDRESKDGEVMLANKHHKAGDDFFRTHSSSVTGTDRAGMDKMKNPCRMENLISWELIQPSSALNKAKRLVTNPLKKYETLTVNSNSSLINPAQDDACRTWSVSTTSETNSKTDNKFTSLPNTTHCIENILNKRTFESSIGGTKLQPDASQLHTCSGEGRISDRNSPSVSTVLYKSCPYICKSVNSSAKLQNQTTACDTLISDGTLDPQHNDPSKPTETDLTASQSGSDVAVPCTKAECKKKVESPLKRELSELEKLVDCLSPDVFSVSSTDVDSATRMERGQVTVSHDCKSSSNNDNPVSRGDKEKRANQDENEAGRPSSQEKLNSIKNDGIALPGTNKDCFPTEASTSFLGKKSNAMILKSSKNITHKNQKSIENIHSVTSLITQPDGNECEITMHGSNISPHLQTTCATSLSDSITLDTVHDKYFQSDANKQTSSKDNLTDRISMSSSTTIAAALPFDDNHYFRPITNSCSPWSTKRRLPGVPYTNQKKKIKSPKGEMCTGSSLPKARSKIIFSETETRKKKLRNMLLQRSQRHLKSLLKKKRLTSSADSANTPGTYSRGWKKSLLKRQTSCGVDQTTNAKEPTCSIHRSLSESPFQQGGSGLHQGDQVLEPCMSCIQVYSSTHISKCGSGHSVCVSCLQGQVKAVLAGNVKRGNIECPVWSCSDIFSIDELTKTLPAFVVDILEEKLEKAYRSYITKWIFTNDSLKSRSEFASSDMGSSSCPASSALKYEKLYKQGTSDSTEEYPPFWTPMELGSPILVYEVIPNSQEYRAIAFQFYKTLQFPNHDIVRIKRIQNPILWKYFALKRSEMVQENGGVEVVEKQLYHGTHRSALVSIARKGFDWRLNGKHGAAYGYGSYFARDARFSHSYTDCGDSGVSFKNLGSISRPMTYSNRQLNLLRSARWRNSKSGGPTVLALALSQNPHTIGHKASNDQTVPNLSLTHSLLNQNSAQPSATQAPPAHHHQPPFLQAHGQMSSLHLPAHQPSQKIPALLSLIMKCSQLRPLPSSPMVTSVAAPAHFSASQSHSSFSNSSVAGTSVSSTNACSVVGTQATPVVCTNLYSATTTSFATDKKCNDPVNMLSLTTNPEFFRSNDPTLDSNIREHEKCFVDLEEAFSCDRGSESRFMFLARVLVGKHTGGSAGLRRPPPVDEKNPYGKAYDSCVDNIFCPRVFVIFENNQAYPEYVIEYVQHRPCE